MRFREIAQLITVTETPAGNGYKNETETMREVFVDEQSATRAEHYMAKSAGAQIAIVFLIRKWDYEGEERIEYEGKRYAVERAHTKDGEILQLNCTEITKTDSGEAGGNDGQ